MLLGAIILAGGRSRRMGRPKESLPWGDGTLLLHTIETLIDCCFPVVVVARDPEQELPPLHTESDLIYDAEPDRGPLAAIATGLRHIADGCDAVFVSGCDAPFLTPAAVTWLAERCGDRTGAVPKIGDRLHPLCAVYHRRILGPIEGLLEKGERRARAIAELDGVEIVDEDTLRGFDAEARFLRNVNTESDYEAAVREAGGTSA